MNENTSENIYLMYKWAEGKVLSKNNSVTNMFNYSFVYFWFQNLIFIVQYAVQYLINVRYVNQYNMQYIMNICVLFK